MIEQPIAPAVASKLSPVGRADGASSKRIRNERVPPRTRYLHHYALACREVQGVLGRHTWDRVSSWKTARDARPRDFPRTSRHSFDSSPSFFAKCERTGAGKKNRADFRVYIPRGISRSTALLEIVPVEARIKNAILRKRSLPLFNRAKCLRIA